uniref:Uncharacterized protein n=1 Tax=Oryza sativa subsp. japonica TaxID=39947 RepID=Q69LZ8_ORYSJ|nr:hypothetical protein [Oryza sativa Japonica Group]
MERWWRPEQCISEESGVVLGPGPKVVTPVGLVVEQAQCDLGGPWLVGQAAHSNKVVSEPRFGSRNNYLGSHVIWVEVTGEIVGPDVCKEGAKGLVGGNNEVVFDGGREGHAERSRKGGTARARSCKGGDGSMVDMEATRSGVEGWHGSPGHAKVVTPRRRSHDLGLEK